MTLVPGGKIIYVLHFNTLRCAGAKEINHHELCSHNASLATMAFTSTPTLPGRQATPTSRTLAYLPTAPSIGALAFSKCPPVHAKLRLQPVVLLPNKTPSSATFSAISSTQSAPSSAEALPCCSWTTLQLLNKLATLAHRGRLSTTNAGCTTCASASSTARSRRT
eukprot:3741162-Pleurochrysis_carterae.AAC.1